MANKQGIVIKSTGSWYSVRDAENEIFDCRIKGKLRIKGIRSTNPLAVGDHVHFETLEEWNDADRQLGVIKSVDTRKNYIIRKSINLSKESHIIASNVDQALLIVTLKNPVTTTTFIDRFLASAEAYNIPVTLVFNKVDLFNEEDRERVELYKAIYSDMGYQCLESSVPENVGLNDLLDAMKDKVNVLAGHSGVGKSTLVNSIDPNLNLRTNEISDYHLQGKHTTTFSEMFELTFGGYIIDTPGIRGFGLLDMKKEEVSHYFRDIFKTSEHCKFNNCTHVHEPGCAVKEAVEKNYIAYCRYESYLNIISEDEDDRYRPAF